MFEAKRIDELAMILGAGGGIEISGAPRHTGDLVALAKAAAAGNAQLHLRGMAARPVQVLALITKAGRGQVKAVDPKPE